MAVILCLETATTNCSVALAVDGKVKALREENNAKFSHAEKLHIFIEDVLKAATIHKKQVDAIAVSKGPGSYTGLRIGVSAAKGLCFGLDIPLISTLTLEGMAKQVECKDCYIIPMLDARRMEVYAAVFNSEKKQIHQTVAEILNETSFLEYLNERKVIFLGDGSQKFKAICSHPNALFLEDVFPTSASMASLAEAKYKIDDTENVAYFEPFYLKEFLMG